MTGTLIRTVNLEKNYSGESKSPAVLKDLNISIQKGEFAIIMGNSGSGKSTLLYLLSGLDKSTAGEIWVDESPLHQLSEKKLAFLRRNTIGFVFQENNLVTNLTILENMLVAGYLINKSRNEVKAYANELLEELGVLHIAHRYPGQVSGGELQRAAIARALINKPAILMADEPTGSLNSGAGEMVLDCLSKLHQQGQTIVMVTHDLKSACRGSRVLFLKDGCIDEENYYSIDKKEADTEANLFGWLKSMGW